MSSIELAGWQLIAAAASRYMHFATSRAQKMEVGGLIDDSSAWTDWSGSSRIFLATGANKPPASSANDLEILDTS